MKKLLILLLIPMFLLGKTTILDAGNFTAALLVFDHTFTTPATSNVIMPVADTTIEASYFGGNDTLIEYLYPWPSVFDQHSYEALIDTSAAGPGYVTFDRWAMEDWAFAFFIEDTGGEDTDSVTIDIQYSFDYNIAWTVPYNLTTNSPNVATLYTFYPSDLYDNWKLYRYSRLAVTAVTDSIRVRGWLVNRQMYFHENVRPGP